MTIEQFEHMLTEAGMNVFTKYAPRFLVSLHVPKEIPLQNGSVVTSMRIQCDALVFEAAEFAQLTHEQARDRIEACKKRLERAAKTKQGVVR
jgi:hypothetical protein